MNPGDVVLGPLGCHDMPRISDAKVFKDVQSVFMFDPRPGQGHGQWPDT